MPKAPIFPRSGAKLNDYLNAAIGHLSRPGNATRLHIDADMIAALNDALDVWNTWIGICSNTNLRTRTATINKDAAAAATIGLLRRVYRNIPADSMIPADRTALNLQVRAARTLAPLPEGVPVFWIDAAYRLRHTIRMHDGEAGSRRAKPHRMRGAQIWYYVGEAAPAGDNQYVYLGLATASKFVADFAMAQGGKKVWYKARWENMRGQTGPWSQVVATMIMP